MVGDDALKLVEEFGNVFLEKPPKLSRKETVRIGIKFAAVCIIGFLLSLAAGCFVGDMIWKSLGLC